MKIDPFLSDRNVAQGSQFLAILGLCEYSRGFAGEGASNESEVFEKWQFSHLSLTIKLSDTRPQLLYCNI